MKRSLISTFAAASFLGLGIGALAVAQSGHGKHGKHGEKRAEMLQKFDANQDGRLDETERDAVRLDRFAAIDTDGNGSLTKDEITAHHAAKMAERIDRHFSNEDVNGDGAISVEEFGSRRKAHRSERRAKRQERRAEMLTKFDADGDGELNETERAAAREAGYGRRGHHGRHHGLRHSEATPTDTEQ